MDNLTIRLATPEDIPQMQAIFAIARTFMAANGNREQWVADYPGEELLKRDIAKRSSYVMETGGEVVATFVLCGEKDPTYDVIYEGAWKNDAPYGTIHRIASSGKVKGVMHRAMEFARERFETVRIDTHRDNRVMIRAILKEHFEYCGIIHCWNGSERLAYQYTSDKAARSR